MISCDHKDLLVHFFPLLEDVLLLFKVARLERLADLDHEGGVGAVGPIVELDDSTVVLIGVWLREKEVYFEQVQEILEQEVLVDVGLNLDWQLTHDILIFLRSDGVVFIIFPEVFEVLLKLLGHFGR